MITNSHTAFQLRPIVLAPWPQNSHELQLFDHSEVAVVDSGHYGLELGGHHAEMHGKWPMAACYF